MRELIYLRSTEGFRDARYSAELSNQDRLFARNCAISARGGEGMDADSVCYRQARIDENRIVLGMSCHDPHGSRDSLFAQMMIADPEETGRLLDSYPVQSPYFAQFQREYEKREGHGDMPGSPEIPVQAFMGDGAKGLNEAFSILREAFGAKERLADVLEALLDVASKNAHMMVLFGQKEREAVMAERGRGIIEALLACLPAVLAIHIGYICPAANARENALFGVRYSQRWEIPDQSRNLAYIYDFTQGTFERPKLVQSGEGRRYAEDLADQVFTGGEAAVKWVKLRRRQLNDPLLFDAQDVPAQIALRYRFYANGLQSRDALLLLDFHHQVIDMAQKEPEQRWLDRSIFWQDVNAWILAQRGALEAIYAQSERWEKSNPVLSDSRVKTIYEDGAKLFALGRKEALAYRRAFEARLRTSCLLNRNLINEEQKGLITHFARMIQGSHDGRYEERYLYWAPIEAWVDSHWTASELTRDETVVKAVIHRYEYDPEGGEKYVPAFAESCVGRKRALLSLEGSKFEQRAQQKILADDSDFVLGHMQRELGGLNPMIEDRVQPKASHDFVRYRALIGENEALQAEYARLCQERLKEALNQTQAVDRLVADLDDPKKGMLARFSEILPGGDGRGELLRRIVELTSARGIEPFYPNQMAVAKRVAQLLDERQGNTQWQHRLSALESMDGFPVENVGRSQFKDMLEALENDERDPWLRDRLRPRLWEKMKSTFSAKTPDLQPVVFCLTLMDMRDEQFCPGRILDNAEKLGVGAKKLLSYCRKNASDEDTKGIGYLSRAILTGADPEAPKWAPYPGRMVERRRKSGDGRAWFAGIPAMAAGIGAAVFGLSLIASVTGMLWVVGLL